MTTAALDALNETEADAETAQRSENTSADVQFISFMIGEEQYGVEIMSVREIKGWSAVTPLPNQPEHVRGVLNLRGDVVPIVDLRRRLSFGQTEATPTHVVIIVEIGDRFLGLLVDRVSDILTFNPHQIQSVPDAHTTAGADYLSGLVTLEDTMIALLDLEKLAPPAAPPNSLAAAADAARGPLPAADQKSA